MTVQSYFRSLRILQLTLFSGFTLSIFISFVLFVIEMAPILPETQGNHIIDILVIALSLSGIISAFYLFQILLVRQHNSSSLARKLSAFKTAYFLRLVIIEALGIIAVLLFIISLSPIALTAAILIAILLGLLKPSKKEMVRVLQLNPGQKAQIMAKQHVIGDLNHEVFRHRLN